MHFIFNSNSDALLSSIIPNDNVDYVKAKLSEIETFSSRDVDVNVNANVGIM